MAGHNKWSKIKHRKAQVEKKKTRAWTKIAKAIMVAAKHGGPDPASNLSLRYAVDEARYANMPRDTIERAIKKGSGELGTETYENVRYEGYGPGGVAVVIDALTNNRTRTAADVRLAFSTHGGNLGATGCVGYMFSTRGQIAVDAGTLAPDKVMDLAIEAGASDVEEPAEPGDPWVLSTEPTDFHRVREAVEKAGLKITEAELAMIPAQRVPVEGKTAEALFELVDTLEDNDDVQKVHTNADEPDGE
jgi:YebC/PmpR family DNA-binding regulatory protein